MPRGIPKTLEGWINRLSSMAQYSHLDRGTLIEMAKAKLEGRNSSAVLRKASETKFLPSKLAFRGIFFSLLDQRRVGLVYYLQNINGNVKIGFTASTVQERILVLLTSSSYPLGLIALEIGSEYLEQERDIEFADLRIN